MIKLERSLRVWGTPDFEDSLKHELAQVGAEQLPLQHALTTGNYVADAPVTITINSITEMPKVIRVRAGIFFQSVIGGCSCADDPTPVSEINEYCEALLEIDKTTADTVIMIPE